MAAREVSAEEKVDCSGKKEKGKKRLQLYKGPQRKWDWRKEAAVAGLEDGQRSLTGS